MLLENELSYKIRGAIFEVYNELGPGLLESINHKALLLELKSRKLKVDSEISLPVFYKGELLDLGFRIDLLCWRIKNWGFWLILIQIQSLSKSSEKSM